MPFWWSYSFSGQRDPSGLYPAQSARPDPDMQQSGTGSGHDRIFFLTINGILLVTFIITMHRILSFIFS